MGKGIPRAGEKRYPGMCFLVIWVHLSVARPQPYMSGTNRTRINLVHSFNGVLRDRSRDCTIAALVNPIDAAPKFTR